MPNLDAFIIDTLRQRKGEGQRSQRHEELTYELPLERREEDRRPPPPPEPPESRGVIIIDA